MAYCGAINIGLRPEPDGSISESVPFISSIVIETHFNTNVPERFVLDRVLESEYCTTFDLRPEPQVA